MMIQQYTSDVAPDHPLEAASIRQKTHCHAVLVACIALNIGTLLPTPQGLTGHNTMQGGEMCTPHFHVSEGRKHSGHTVWGTLFYRLY